MELKLVQTEQASGEGCASTACGAGPEQMAALPESVRDKVRDHPCYSEGAHHHYARMHVAVAPACNIQCNYCNRKYDCSNESRPGVVSQVLTPEQAVAKTLAVAAAIPRLSVVGIAGPGDPLANPKRSFETFRQLAKQAPDLKLCISTNGLTLPEHVDELVALGVDHVTITINCLDPEIGAKIYPWIFWNHRRVRGIKAARILIGQQLKGLDMLVVRGVLVKVNSVMIPGINDRHLEEVSRFVRDKGAFLHNIMPLISDAAHGTYFGVTGQRGPSAAELDALRDACGDANIMRHCRQCRADAVGMLGEDRGAEFSQDRLAAIAVDPEMAARKRAEVRDAIESQRAEEVALRAKAEAERRPADAGLRPVLVAVASSGDGLVNLHFGSAREFLVYEASARGARFIGTRRADNYCHGPATCGDGAAALPDIIRALEGCEAVLCAKVGFKPWKDLEAAGIAPNGEHAGEPIEEAVAAVYREMAAAGTLTPPLSGELIA